MLTINGAYGEGGGQIVRTCLSLSAITGIPVTINRIRANRPKPGLYAQHLAACLAASEITQAEIQGATIGSEQLSFVPKRICAGQYHFTIGTAGSVTLVAQTIIPILLNASQKSRVIISGGTHVIKSPGYDYFEKVFIHAITKFGANVKSRLIKPGFYPKGGGEIELLIQPSQLRGVDQWPHTEVKHALIRLARLPQHIAEREKHILQTNGINDIRIVREDAVSPGNSVTVWHNCCGAYAVGERGKPAEAIANEAVAVLLPETKDVDRYLADQLLIYAVMAAGKTQYRTSVHTDHLLTNLHVMKKFFQRDVQLQDGIITII